MTHRYSPPSDLVRFGILYLMNGFLTNFSRALCYAVKFAMILEPEKASDKSTKVRCYSCWKLPVKGGSYFIMYDSFNNALAKTPCHRLAEDLMGKNGQGTCSFCTTLCLGTEEWGCPQGTLTVCLSWKLRGMVCQRLRVWRLWVRLMMKTSPGGKAKVTKGHSNTLDMRREETAWTNLFFLGFEFREYFCRLSFGCCMLRDTKVLYS